MAWDPSLQEAYYGLAIGFQLLLVWLVLRAGRPDAVQVAIAAVIGLSALEGVNVFARRVLDTRLLFRGEALVLLDTPLLIAITFLLTQVPRPLGGNRRKRAAVLAWIGCTLTSVLLLWWLLKHQPRDAWYGYKNARIIIHDGQFALAAGLLALHGVPRWLETNPGPLRSQSWMLLAGLGLSTAFFSTAASMVGFTNWPPGKTRIPFMVGLWFSSAAVARLGLAYMSQRRRDVVLFAGILASAMAVGLKRQFFGGAPTLMTDFGRPILIAAAILRFRLFEVPARLRRGLTPVTAVASLAMGFVGAVVLLSPDGLGTATISPSTAILAFGAVAAIAAASQSKLAEALRAAGEMHEPGTGGRASVEALDRYRLALEKGAPPSELARLRTELNVHPDQHATLEAILSRHLIVPTEAFQGASPGQLLAERYEIVRELGKGGQGRALLAIDVETDEHVVVKEVLRAWAEDAAAQRKALEREARIGERVASENLAHTLDMVDDGYTLYLVREYVPGQTLDGLVGDRGPLAPDEVRSILAGILQGLEALHRRGLLHLDLKPQNIILDRGGSPVIIDFGTVAASPTQEGDATQVTVTAASTPGSSAVGTVAWMAPEQITGGELDARTDLFALGAICYLLLTGEHHVPVDGSSRHEIEASILAARLPPLDELPTDLATFIERTLAADPARRVTSAGEASRLLDGEV